MDAMTESSTGEREQFLIGRIVHALGRISLPVARCHRAPPVWAPQ
jgi:hypothetical protein